MPTAKTKKEAQPPQAPKSTATKLAKLERMVAELGDAICRICAMEERETIDKVYRANRKRRGIINTIRIWLEEECGRTDTALDNKLRNHFQRHVND